MHGGNERFAFSRLNPAHRHITGQNRRMVIRREVLVFDIAEIWECDFGNFVTEALEGQAQLRIRAVAF